MARPEGFGPVRQQLGEPSGARLRSRAMNLFSIWPPFGFHENPYSNQNLPPDETGDQLLVGRDAEVERLARSIGSMGTHPSVEGLAGVGKSSLIAVAGYRMMQRCIASAGGTLFLPATRFFQASESLDDFVAEVYWEVAQTLIARVDAFRHAGLTLPDVAELNKWLNNPQYREGGLTIAGTGGSAASSPNETEGFLRSGFPAAIRRELERVFPGPGAGGIVCVLDNLELLQTSAEARSVLEGLRDEVFNLPGLRWVLCGSRGIVSRARSQRLSGIFNPPLILGPLPQEASAELIARRIDYFGTDAAYPPVTPASFEFLYRALNQNLRDALAYAQQFSQWLYGEYIAVDLDLPAQHEIDQFLQVWLTEEADGAHAEARSVQRRQWQFFDDLAKRGGSAGANEWESYGFSTQQQFSSSVTALVNTNLAVRETDPDNAARSLATITPQGWLVHFHRNRYSLPTSDT